jgi:prepilin-type N-terminal cleavage/methylation domain-containing protein
MIRTNKGFTLIELMVVIVIIGVLAALAIPKFTDASTKAKFAEIPTVMGSYDHAQLAYIAETGKTNVSDSLVFTAPSGSKWFSYDGTTAGKYIAKNSVAVGPLTTVNTEAANTVVAVPDAITHTPNTLVKKYLNNF